MSALQRAALLLRRRCDAWLSRHLGLRARVVGIADWLATEYGYRFRRRLMRTEMDALRSIPRNLHLEGSNLCNAACVFCAYPQMERPKLEMPMADFRRIVDEYVALGGRGVSLTPIVGDPFVDRQLFERLDYLAGTEELKGFYFYTNAISMRSMFHERLLAYGERLHIHVSLGGFDRETYASIMGVDQFRAVQRNLGALVDSKRAKGSRLGLSLEIRCPPEKCRGDFWNRCRSWQGEGLLRIAGAPSYDSWAGRIRDEDLKRAGLVATRKPHKRGPCQLLFFSPIVLADGRVNACACRDVEAELIIGNLKESPLSDIWSGEGATELIERHERGDFPDVCRRCTWYRSIYNARVPRAGASVSALAWHDDVTS